MPLKKSQDSLMARAWAVQSKDMFGEILARFRHAAVARLGAVRDWRRAALPVPALSAGASFLMRMSLLKRGRGLPVMRQLWVRSGKKQAKRIA